MRYTTVETGPPEAVLSEWFVPFSAQTRRNRNADLRAFARFSRVGNDAVDGFAHVCALGRRNTFELERQLEAWLTSRAELAPETIYRRSKTINAMIKWLASHGVPWAHTWTIQHARKISRPRNATNGRYTRKK